MRFKGYGRVRWKHAKRHTAIEENHGDTDRNTLKASFKPCQRYGQAPQSEYPAAGTDMVGIAGKQPDQNARQRNIVRPSSGRASQKSPVQTGYLQDGICPREAMEM